VNAKDSLGRRGEQAAVEYLERAGLRILDRNWRCADGEIDIVAAERQVLVICEVKTAPAHSTAARSRRSPGASVPGCGGSRSGGWSRTACSSTKCASM
jgi:hypothetical protein